MIRRECTITNRQICKTEECSTSYQTVCDNDLPSVTRTREQRQLDIPGHRQLQKQRTFGNFGLSGNLGAGIGLGNKNRPGLSANIGGGIGLVNNKKPGVGISGNLGAGVGVIMTLVLVDGEIPMI